jgi:hypothetical protein
MQPDEFERVEEFLQKLKQTSDSQPLLGHVFVCYGDMTNIACDALIAINVVNHYTTKYREKVQFRISYEFNFQVFSQKLQVTPSRPLYRYYA